ncbi:MAG: hypothetical protein COV67_06375 [Nitrospinae bacterium CG11_big_fil_rev_8_21_14_0_20_56_8]|nr:MAG: hypothetical protein COV67_06375 [Nitrospinae bacterium CG11_big_fil_rev_8_21_14_0_20_56_8]
MGVTERFVSRNPETVMDTQTKLMWCRTDSMNDLKKWVNYPDSADYVRGLNEKRFAGFDDWRLPTQAEMQTLYDEALVCKDQFAKDIHISPVFHEGGGFSMIARLVDGRFRTWVLNLRDGQLTQPDGLWTLSESARAVRTLKPEEIAQLQAD